MVSFAGKYCGLNTSQYGGKRGTVCQSAVINKVLSYEIARLTKTSAAGSEVDAAGCYDAMIPELVTITTKRLGMPDEPGWLLLEILEEMEHYIRTQHRD